MASLRPPIIALSAVLISALSTACASAGLDPYFGEGRYEEAVGVFESDPELGGDERALFEAAVSYGLPGTGVHDPARARELFGRLRELFPSTSYAEEAAWFTAFLDHQAALRAEIRRLQRELEELKAIDLGREADPDGP